MALTEVELFAITSVGHLAMALYSRTCPESPLLEFIFYAVPQYLVFRFLKQAYLIYLVLFGCLMLFPKKFQREYTNHTSPVDRIRFLIIFLVALAIYSADFKFYDSSKLGKSMGFGLLLMDIGVGSFVFNAGFVSSRANASKKLSNSLKSFVLGLARFTSKFVFSLNVKEEEFGRHLNFFFNLGFLNIISIGIRPRHGFIVGLLMLLTHQALLQTFLQDLIFNNSRSNIFLANLEGICFLLPQFGVYLMCQEIGQLFLEKKNLRKITLYNFICIIIFMISKTYQDTCRRLHNLPFSLLIVILHVTHILLYNYLNIEQGLGCFKLATFSSKNLLFVLLFSNMLIPISRYANIFCSEEQWVIHAKILAYLALVFYVPFKIKETCGEIFKKGSRRVAFTTSINK